MSVAGLTVRSTACAWANGRAASPRPPRSVSVRVVASGKNLHRPVRAVEAIDEAELLSASTDPSSSDSSSDPSARLTAVRDLNAAYSATPEESAAGADGADEGNKSGLSGSVKGMLLLNLAAALFGSNQVAIKSAEASCTPGILSALRFTSAAICFAPDTIKAMKDPKIRTAALELGVYLTGGYLGQAFGLTQTTATHGALTGTFTVIAVPMYVGLFGGKVSSTTWISAVVAMLGVGLLTTDGTMPNVGDACCIASALIFGLHKYRSEAITRENPEGTKKLMAAQLSVLAAGSMIAAGAEITASGEGIQHTIDMIQGLPVINLLYMGVATTALTLWIEMESLKDVSAPVAALIYTTEPLWGAGFAYFLMGDRWGPQGWVGAGLIVAASAGSQLMEAMKDKEPAEMAKEL